METVNRKSGYIKFVLLACLLLAFLTPACSRMGSSINGSGKIIDQDLKVNDFNSINIKGAFRLEIYKSAAYKVTLSTDDNLINRVVVSLERRSLQARIEAPATFYPTSLKISVGMPEIANLNLAEGVQARITGFTGIPHFILFLSDNSVLTGDIEAAEAKVNLSKASQMSLKGTVIKLELEGSDCKLDMGELNLVNAQVKLSQASEATINVSGNFSVVLNDASKIYYLGNPLINNTVISGGSTMIRK